MAGHGIIELFFSAILALSLQVSAETEQSIGNEEFKAVLACGRMRCTRSESVRFDRVARVARIQIGRHLLLAEPGMVDEFGIHGDGVLNYEEGGVNGEFLKIGVGVFRRDRKGAFDFEHSYPEVREIPGKRINFDALSATFEQNGEIDCWSYSYRKTYRVNPRKKTLTIFYSIRNLGRKPFLFEHYNHHYFAVNGYSAAPGAVLSADFPLEETQRPWLNISGSHIVVSSGSQNGRRYYSSQAESKRESWKMNFYFGRSPDSPAPSGEEVCGVRMEGNFRVARFALFLNRFALCPEIFMNSNLLKPGEEKQWSVTYTFFMKEVISKVR